ncbi:MAG: NAD(P)-binding domain-containing protein [Bacteroidales bacterium]|nr:NAD(P)-binding domain-containing protein [Bacteroidales bacterium]
MNDRIKKIIILGGGTLGTALGQILSAKENLQVTILSIESEVVTSINTDHINQKYFPNIKLNASLVATSDESTINQADIILLAIPSTAVVDYLLKIKQHLNSKSVLVNLAKVFGKSKKTIVEDLTDLFDNPVCALKGPTFAREIINNSPTSFTLGTRNKECYKRFSEVFANTNIYLDFTNDIIGVELLSILKNIYAIIIGIVDANFNSANLRFLVLTHAYNEMREILLELGGQKKTMFKYCGYGDFSLTALNDLSRNRTLGLLIGKGFFTKEISDKVVLEGKIAVNVFHEKLMKGNNLNGRFPMLGELYKVFDQEYDIPSFVTNILKLYRTHDFSRGIST